MDVLLCYALYSQVFYQIWEFPNTAMIDVLEPGNWSTEFVTKTSTRRINKKIFLKMFLLYNFPWFINIIIEIFLTCCRINNKSSFFLLASFWTADEYLHSKTRLMFESHLIILSLTWIVQLNIFLLLQW